MYNPIVFQHFRHPQNYGRMKKPDGVGKVGNLVCGDVIFFYIRVGKNKKGEAIIKEVSFETFGCAAAIANSSVTTEMVKGKTLDQALAIDKKDIVKELGDLPAIKIHCSVLASEALGEAIYDYLQKNKKEIPKDLELRHQHIARAEKKLKEKFGDMI